MSKRILRRILVGLMVLLLIATYAFFFVISKRVDRSRNTIAPHNEPSPSAQARELHRSLVVADLHTDSLLWDRDLNQRHDHGHVDIPRLMEGNVAFQIFDAVVHAPGPIQYHGHHGAHPDRLGWLAAGNRWPIRTWTSFLERALYQSERLHGYTQSADARLRVVRSSGDLSECLAQRSARNGQLVCGLLSVEGLHALEGHLSNVDRLYRAGYRQLGLTHSFDNAVGGSSTGMARRGLTPFGRRVLERMHQLGFIVDLAHASSELITQVLDVYPGPIVVSHTGLRGTWDTPRNLSDDELRRIAERGGLIGVGFWRGAIQQPTVDEYVRTLEHAIAVAGVEHVALGSDWDGFVESAVDAAHVDRITMAMLARHWDHEQIRAVMGGNQVRFFQQHLPASR